MYRALFEICWTIVISYRDARKRIKQLWSHPEISHSVALLKSCQTCYVLRKRNNNFARSETPTDYQKELTLTRAVGLRRSWRCGILWRTRLNICQVPGMGSPISARARCMSADNQEELHYRDGVEQETGEKLSWGVYLFYVNIFKMHLGFIPKP